MPRQKMEEANDKSLMLRLPERILKACQVRAQRERRSLNQQMLWLIENALDESQETSHHALAGSRDT
jgi:hypothetical protein